MEDKIKEILSFEQDADYKRLSVEDMLLLKEYIINLQESEAYYYGQYKDYKSRNKKAIEFIIENCDALRIDNGYIIRSELTTYGLGELLTILKGSDK